MIFKKRKPKADIAAIKEKLLAWARGLPYNTKRAILPLNAAFAVKENLHSVEEALEMLDKEGACTKTPVVKCPSCGLKIMRGMVLLPGEEVERECCGCEGAIIVTPEDIIHIYDFTLPSGG